MARSKLDLKQLYEYESSLFVEKVIIRNGWKYREQEKDNDIDGEIEVFSEDGEATAKIIKVQLKASKSLKYKDEFVIFDCPVKFLNFCDVCDIPIILVVYDVDEEKAYWAWTQKYIFKYLDNEDLAWRNNTSSVRLKIPIKDELKEDKEFYNAIEKISCEGVNELQQWKKHETSEYYFTILEEKDHSNLRHRRISAKVYIERSFATSKDSMIELIKKINKKVKTNNYSKQIFGENERIGKPDYIWLYLYDDLIQYKSGLPFCRTESIYNKEGNDPILLKDYDLIIRDHNIRIKWEDNYRPLQDYLLLNSTNKTEYLKDIKKMNDFAMEQLESLILLFDKENKAEFYNKIITNRKEYTQKFLAMSNVIPPFECQELHRILYEALTCLDNLAEAVELKHGNDHYLNNQYVKNFQSILSVLEFKWNNIV
ncbi:DUF4365 domain-containing protein [Priestia megaterium]|uniref:DUF4365 domain-containing protein n=1 Tax=Priestia megaterium TaxID=1404 RepID=UPI002E1DDE0C|nr:DUF4365 domain-containing protein [Priestia megaterium]